VQHETIRVAVLDMVGDTMLHHSLPLPLRQAGQILFSFFLFFSLGRQIFVSSFPEKSVP
jgi:phosphatidylglycerophosphate synthase